MISMVVDFAPHPEQKRYMYDMIGVFGTTLAMKIWKGFVERSGSLSSPTFDVQKNDDR